jgi:hypothetical protein
VVTLNRQVFAKDPTGFSIPNDGVARVGIPANEQEWQTLRWELESFVCEGEYRVGLERILATYLARLDQPRQPAVWVSGFYGSGKSHLVRVLDALWRDLGFPDGASARGLVQLPSDISDHLAELSTAARREGGVWSAAGTLSTGIGASVRLAILRFVFRAAGLPEDYVKGRFVLWLRREGYLAAVESTLTSAGRTLAGELTNMHMSGPLASALLAAAPTLAGSPAEVLQLLRVEYPTNVSEIGSDEFVATLLDVLAQETSIPGRLPLVLVVLDELQQFLAEDPKRTLEVQDIVERCSSELEGRLLFVGTGQMQLGATPALQKLRDRFTVQVALSDSDVDRVVRSVVLRKDPTRVAEVARVLDHASGEINRQLGGTKIGARGADAQDLVPDYPLLPARRRFWEAILRSVDSAGKAGQLRAQLRIVLEATQAVAGAPLGTVIRADAMYDPILTDLQQTGVLPRDTATLIAGLEADATGDQLKARIAKLAFLIARLEEGGPLATGVRATPDMLADLLVDDLDGGGAEIRRRVPEAIAAMTADGVLLEVDGQYVLQTPVAAEWLQAFQHEASRLRNDDVWLADRRSRAIRTAIGEQIAKTTLLQGRSRVPRKVSLSFGDSLPTSSGGDIPIWVRDGWSTTANAVQDEARVAGIDSPVVFVFVPRLDAETIRDAMSAQSAADNVVHGLPTPQTEEGIQAQSGIASRGQTAGTRLATAIANVLAQARVFQGGGNEVTGASLRDTVDEAAKASLTRLFPRFGDGDDPGWGKVAERVKQGSANPLGALGYAGEPGQQPACAEVLRHLSGGERTGKDVRLHFMGGEFGWPGDAVDGALYALVATGLVRSRLNGSPVPATAIPQNSLGSVVFQVESIVLPAAVKIEVKGLATKLGIPVAGIADADIPGRIVDRLLSLADQAGGDPPLPAVPSHEIARDLQGLTANEQTLRIHERMAELLAHAEHWTALAATKDTRVAAWSELHDLLLHAEGGDDKAEIDAQVDAIRRDRSLLEDPDPVGPLLVRLASTLRARYSLARDRYDRARSDALSTLEADELWTRLSGPQRDAILSSAGLDGQPAPGLETTAKLIKALEATSPREWEDRVDALPARVAKAREQAAKLLEPAAVRVTPPAATIRTQEDLEAYLDELRKRIEAQLVSGPVVL